MSLAQRVRNLEYTYILLKAFGRLDCLFTPAVLIYILASIQTQGVGGEDNVALCGMFAS